MKIWGLGQNLSNLVQIIQFLEKKLIALLITKLEHHFVDLEK